MSITISEETAKSVTESWDLILENPEAGAQVGELIYKK